MLTSWGAMSPARTLLAFFALKATFGLPFKRSVMP